MNAIERGKKENENDYVKSLATSLFNKLYDKDANVEEITDKAISDATKFIETLNERTKV